MKLADVLYRTGQVKLWLPLALWFWIFQSHKMFIWSGLPGSIRKIAHSWRSVLTFFPNVGERLLLHKVILYSFCRDKHWHFHSMYLFIYLLKIPDSWWARDRLTFLVITWLGFYEVWGPDPFCWQRTINYFQII